jgi:hypothetical protein
MSTKFNIINKFRGYQNRLDKTNIEPGFLVVGSKNVLLNDGERVTCRRGYTVDGQTNTASTPIESAFDWFRHLGDERHLRAYDDELEYRYVDSDGTVTWRRLADSFTSVEFNFTVFWDSTELIERLLMVNGTSNIFDWSGGITTFASATANTITKQGTTTWAEEGFYTTGTRSVVIDGTTYTYTGGEGTTTLTGVTPDPTLGAYTAGEVIHQSLRTTANSSMTGIPATFSNDLISVLNNQVYVGSLTNNQNYVSNQNSFTDYSFSSPRTPGEGALLTLDGPPTGYVPQEEFMYISAGNDYWYQIGFQLSADQTNEAVTIQRLKTTTGQSAQSQALISKIKNDVIFVSNEPTMSTLGRIELVETPQTVDISDIIKFDFDTYDFTNGCTFYHRDFIYVAIPTDDIVIIYNLQRGFWEAPQVLPIRRFAIIDGELYGHSSRQPETYKLFTGTSDRSIDGESGNPINSVAAFSYMQYGDRANYKAMTEWYTEGYIQPNTTLTQTLLYDYNGSGGQQIYEISGSDSGIIFNTTSDGSLGKQSLGKFSLAGRGDTTDSTLPPKFRVKNTFAKKDFFEVQPVYSTNAIDARWEILAYGCDVSESTDQSSSIKR